LKDVFVPEAHTTSFPDFQSHRPGPLYAYPLMFLYLFPAVALGVARAAIDAFTEIANRREITVAALGGQRVLLRTASYAQATISRAEGLVRSSRSHVHEVMREIWATLVRGEPLSRELCDRGYQRPSKLLEGGGPALQGKRRFICICARAARPLFPRHPHDKSASSGISDDGREGRAGSARP
jgi:hypothetical protein